MTTRTRHIRMRTRSSTLASRWPTRAVLLALMVLLSPTFLGAQEQSTDDGWRVLFNGKDLDGWIPKITGEAVGEDSRNTFRVEDGVMKVVYDNYETFDGSFGHLFFHEPFSKYRLRVEYRFVGDQCPGGPGWAFRNSGIMFHAQSAESMRKDQEFPVSIEAQMLGGDGSGERPTGSVCTPGTHVVIDGKRITQHCTNSTSKTYHGDQWVTMELEVHGDDLVKHKINGETVMVYEKPQLDPGDADARPLIQNGQTALTGGYFALQAESHPVEFRKVEIQPIDD